MNISSKKLNLKLLYCLIILLLPQIVLAQDKIESLNAPDLLYPANNSFLAENPQKFDWSDVENAEKYALHLTYPDKSLKVYNIPQPLLSPQRVNILQVIIKFFKNFLGRITGYAVFDLRPPSEFIISDEFWASLPYGKYSWKVAGIDFNGEQGEFSVEFFFTKIEKRERKPVQPKEKVIEIPSIKEKPVKISEEILNAFYSLPKEEKIRYIDNAEQFTRQFYGFTNKIDTRLLNSTFLLAEGYLDNYDEIPAILLLEEGKSISNLRITIKREFKLINGVSVYLKQNELARLASLDGVRGIYLNERLSIPKPVEHDKTWEEKESKDNRNELINSAFAWSQGYKGDSVNVAVIDTGVDKYHPDLVGKVIGEESFVLGETPNDGHGHGTHVAGLVAGTGSASNGKYQGVAPNALVINVKVMSNSGMGKTDDIIAGIEWAVANGADVISMSLGGTPFEWINEPLTEAVNMAVESGVVVVVAAGNEGWW